MPNSAPRGAVKKDTSVCGDNNALVRNSTSFPVRVSARLRVLFKEYQEILARGDVQNPERLAASGLKYYQFLVRAVMTNPEFGIGECGNARGLLIYHTMGMGKTFLAVATAMALWDVRPPIVIVAKALQENFIQTVEKFVRMLHPGLVENELKAKQAVAVRRFKFVSIDAYNMASQVAKATTGAGGPGSLNGRLLVVDEAHNLFRGIINSPNEKTNARRLYEMVMEARNLRILFLTGTPASKDPFELVPCFNMLAGLDLLPTQYEVFYKHYVDLAESAIRNRGKLANRLLGLVSHVAHTLPSDPGKAKETGSARLRGDGGFPEEIETIFERVEMSAEQYRQYLLAREKEEAEGKSGESGFAPSERITSSPVLSLPGSETGAGSTYYVKSRTLSNFAPPRDERDRAVDAMSDDVFSENTSPKASRLVSNLAKSPGPALIYSQFVGVGGLAVIARFLQSAGYVEFVLSCRADDYGLLPPTDGAVDAATSSPAAPCYAIISGSVKAENRIRLQEVFNSPGNAHGERIRALLVSKTGAEGLDLKGVRQVHIFEPYWDKSREDQVKARGVRLGSHDHLPVEEREVQPFLYIAVANQKMLEGLLRSSEKEAEAPLRKHLLVEELTIDEKFHTRALNKHTLNEAFRVLLREVCLECSINGYGNCRLCIPTDAPLFHEDPIRDLFRADPCQTVFETEISVQEIRLPGDDTVVYFFRKEPTAPFGVRFFVYDDGLEAYTPVDPASGVFMRLYEALDGPTGEGLSV
ncbi:BA71V-Q706L (J10L) protein [Elysia marginata]|uniref:BA71V-Q706L (J10L) protein n=1 Tax=Elysia marginata TaxID=1093978 RepID=A0AAV4H0T3_9GAST|nr:BA71V-Q706L (J10L) protein [Elysia marginata]